VRRKSRAPVHVEPPSWYRMFDPAAWDEPDGQEQAMISGWGPMNTPWPDRLHEIHAERRWNQAKHAYRGEHPALAEQEFLAIVANERDSRARERHA